MGEVSASCVPDTPEEEEPDEEELEEEEPVADVAVCCVCGSSDDVRCCGNCKAAKYCSKGCQRKHWEHHSVYCGAIVDLEQLEKEKFYRNKTVRQNQINSKVRLKMLKLVGNKPKIRCRLDGKSTEMLWDTGSQVSLVDKRWVNQHFPDKEILPVADFLEREDLKLCAANNSEIQFEGVVLLKFGLKDGEDKFEVPMLVSKSSIAEPILGYNVIEELVLDGGDDDHKLLHSCFHSVRTFKIEAFVALIQDQASSPDFLSEVKVPESLTVPAGHRRQVRCVVRDRCDEDEQTVYFSPKLNMDDEDLEFLETVTTLRRGRTNHVFVEVMNKTNHDMVLNKGLVMGSIHSVSAVVPMMKAYWDGGQVEKPCTVFAEVNAVGEDKDDWVPPADLSHLDEEQEKKVREVLKEERDVFSRSDTDIGDIKDFHMKIHLQDDVPVKEAYRRIPRNLYSEVRDYINDLLTNGWIKESFSSYASPIVCVRKKDGGLRMFVDYRKLNGKTVADSQPIPRIQDIIDGLAGNKWFTTLDMSKAYHQGYVDEASRHVTAFATPWTLYEWIRIPFGLRNAPPAFQRYMNSILGDMKGFICDPYLDDVLCYAKVFDDGVADLKKVLRRLKSRGIKLRAEKCAFLRTEVRYLGRLISAEGYRMDPADTEALERFREAPKNVGDVRSLLGFLGYYRCYVKNFARIVKPLYELLKEDGKTEVKKPKAREVVKKDGGKKKGQQYDSRAVIQWNDELQKIVDGLIDHLKSGEIIAYPDWDLPFFLTTDASNYGLGAVLYQKQNGVDRVISYASRTLTDAEKNYNLHSGKLEFLALKWAITERFSDYLKHGPPFQVFTDNNPLTYVLTSAKLNATGLRWVADLAEFQFSIKYRPGKMNADADGLSRRPLEISDLQRLCTESVEPSSVAAVFVNSTSMGKGDVPVVRCNAAVCELSVPEDESLFVGKEELVAAQKADPVIGPVLTYVEQSLKPKRADWGKLSGDSKVLMRSFAKLKVVGGVLFRKTARYRQIVLPQKYRQTVYVELHEKMGHVGPEKVIELAQQRFYWPRMSADITEHIRKRCRCIVTKKPNQTERAPLVPIKATYPFEMVAMDFLHLDKCKGGYEYVLVIVDHFTRFAQFYATKSKSSQAAAAKLWNEFLPTFGFPRRILHDKGGEWNSKMWAELHRYSGVKAVNTTPYHPEGDGITERINRTALNMLKAIPENQKKRWKEQLPKLAFAYNSTIHKSTGFSPFYLMFGRQSKLPIDFMFGLEEEVAVDRKSHRQFVADWKESMQQAFDVANENIGKAGDYNKKHYDQKIRGDDLSVGDQVLMRNMREQGGTGKLRSHWERGVFEVLEKKEGLPVYVIQNVQNKKDTRTVHRNLLMECNELPSHVFEGEKSTVKGKNVGKKAVETPKKKAKKGVSFEGDCTSDADDNDDALEVLQRLAENVSSSFDGEGSGDVAAAEDSEDALVAGEFDDSEVTQDADDSVMFVDLAEAENQHNDESESIVDDVTSAAAEHEPVIEVPVPVSPLPEPPELENIDDSPVVPVRRTMSRNRVPKKVFTMDKLGGEPELVEITRSKRKKK